mmetsp:Transcript_23712/g.34573  ORF Transcript_23712/g.34573 Transcript_23712/m.34573 type:complete len:427 (-) Transcript_23712:367-1647(-)
MSINPNYVPPKQNVKPNDESKNFDSIQDSKAIKCLLEQGYTDGLVQTLLSSIQNQTSPVRFWIIDNSGSMNTNDGYRILETRHRHEVKVAPCTRWEELRECVNYHIDLAGLLRAKSHFRVLNPQLGITEFGIAAEARMVSSDPGRTATDSQIIEREVRFGKQSIRKIQASGVTPLTEHILYIYDYLVAMSKSDASFLSVDGAQISIIIATDGLPTDDEGYGGKFANDQFINALRSIQQLSTSIWIVIRLCTTDDDVVSFYNSLDVELELPLELLDDFRGEAREVAKFNPWINYALPLHRCREFGLHDRILDLMDERQLTRGEVRDFCSLLFGEEKCSDYLLPDPEVDWEKFLVKVKELNNSEEKQWNPLRKRASPWIDVKLLHRAYGNGLFSKFVGIGPDFSWGDVFLLGVAIAVLARVVFDGIFF